MSRATRCEFQGAIHLITLRGHCGGAVFYDPLVFKHYPENPRGHAPAAEYFECLLWDTSEQYNARIHAFAIESNSALLVVQTRGAPLSWMVHDLLARYSTYFIENDRSSQGVRPFPKRYKSQIVEPAKLPYAVRYVQRRPATADGRRRASNYPFGSSLIYCGRRLSPKCFVVRPTLLALEKLGHFGPSGYFEFMAQDDSPAIACMLSGRIVGEQNFSHWVRDQCKKVRSVPSLEELSAAVAYTLLHTHPNVAFAPTHQGALLRALVAWYAMRTGAAHLRTVGRWFGVTSSDLRYLIRRHRKRNPQHFSRALQELIPAMTGLDGELSEPPPRQIAVLKAVGSDR